MLSRVRLFVTPWTAALQASVRGIFLGENTGVGYRALFQGDLLDAGIKPVSPESPAWAGGSLPLSHLGSPIRGDQIIIYSLSIAKDL